MNDPTNAKRWRFRLPFAFAVIALIAIGMAPGVSVYRFDGVLVRALRLDDFTAWRIGGILVLPIFAAGVLFFRRRAATGVYSSLIAVKALAFAAAHAWDADGVAAIDVLAAFDFPMLLLAWAPTITFVRCFWASIDPLSFLMAAFGAFWCGYLTGLFLALTI